MFRRIPHFQVSCRPKGYRPVVQDTKVFGRGGKLASIQTFLVISTCCLYVVAAGLFSKAVWRFEANKVCTVESEISRVD